MINYWCIKTSPYSHIDWFIKLIKKNATIGDILEITKEESDYHINLYGEKILTRKESAFKQMIIGWLALGLVQKEDYDKYKIICSLEDRIDLSYYSKIYIIKKTNDKKVNKYRTSKLVNCLYASKIYSMSDLIKIGIKGTKGNVTHEKILKEISKYEKLIIQDQAFLNKAKEIIDAI